MTLLITTALFLITILCNTVSSFATQLDSMQSNSAMAQQVAPSESSSSNLFAAELFPLIVEQKSTKNVVVSPASIYTSLALVYLGAEGNTSAEIRSVLKLGQESKMDFAAKYGNILRSTFKTPKAADNTAPHLKMANRLYVTDKLKIKQQFNKIAEENFNCKAENVDFSEDLTVVEKINKWVEQQTENKIKNLMKPGAVNEDTSAVLVNAIYFKAKWLRPFSLLATSKNDFHISSSEIVEVDTMYTDDKFGYVELDDLNAKAIEMPYENSDISMVIILPNNKGDLESLEKGLKGKRLNDITSAMTEQQVEVFLPKFRIEFDIDLKEALKKLGCSTMFGDDANLSSIFEENISQKIADIKHKAFLDCNEAGSEAAAASFVKMSLMSFDMNKKTFRADSPFAFFIRSNTTVFFAGHLARV